MRYRILNKDDDDDDDDDDDEREETQSRPVLNSSIYLLSFSGIGFQTSKI